MEKNKNELYLVREIVAHYVNRCERSIEEFAGLYLCLKNGPFYHQSGKVLGGLSIGLIKQGGTKVTIFRSVVLQPSFKIIGTKSTKLIALLK